MSLCDMCVFGLPSKACVSMRTAISSKPVQEVDYEKAMGPRTDCMHKLTKRHVFPVFVASMSIHDRNIMEICCEIDQHTAHKELN